MSGQRRIGPQGPLSDAAAYGVRRKPRSEGMARTFPTYGSDIMAQLLVDQGIRYVALNPGASFRGLHDSLVNLPGAPEMILVPHENLAINIAHGYAKATGELMGTVLHDTVGLLHA